MAWALFLCFPGSLLRAEEAPADSKLLWRQALGGEIRGLPMAQARSVVLVLDGGNLKAYSSEGKPLWNYFSRSRLAPFVSRSREGTSYICKLSPGGGGRTNGVLTAVNRAGRELWQIRLGGPLLFPVLIGWDGRIFVFTEKRINCYTASGHPLWSKTLEHSPALRPRLDLRGGFITVLEDGELVDIDPFGRSSSRTLGEIPAAALSTMDAGGRLSILVCYKNGRMELVNSAASPSAGGLAAGSAAYPGSGFSSLPALPAPLAAAAAGAGGAALFLRNGALSFLSLPEGRILWSRDTGLPGEEAELLFDERGICLLTKTGAAAYSEAGEGRWFLGLQGAAALPCFSDEGILYSGGGDWILYAYRMEDQVQAGEQSFYGPAPGGDYGTGQPPPPLRRIITFAGKRRN
jgi:outer membrane protein assembly factor BamB